MPEGWMHRYYVHNRAFIIESSLDRLGTKYSERQRTNGERAFRIHQCSIDIRSSLDLPPLLKGGAGHPGAQPTTSKIEAGRGGALSGRRTRPFQRRRISFPAGTLIGLGSHKHSPNVLQGEVSSPHKRIWLKRDNERERGNSLPPTQLPG